MKSETQSSFNEFVRAELSGGNRNSRKGFDNRDSSRRDNRDTKSTHTESGTKVSLSRSVNLNFKRPTATIVNHYDIQGNSYTEAIAGVCGIPITTTLTNSESSLSALNVSTSVLYSQYREKISGRKNYDAVDLAMYVYAMNQIHCMYHFLARAVKVANKYDPINYTTPKLLLKAMGFKPDVFINDLPQWYTFMDTLCNKLNALPVPDVYPLYRKQRSMFDYLYYDNNATKSQIYMFIPETFGTLVTYAQSGGTGLKIDYSTAQWSAFIGPNTGDGASLSSVKILISTMIDNVVTSLAAKGVDAALIAGDTQRVYSKCIKVSPIKSTDAAPYTYDMKMLQKIQNATLMLFDSTYSGNIVQEELESSTGRSRGYIRSTFSIAPSADAIVDVDRYTTGKFINSLTANPTDAAVCESLELCPIYAPGTIITSNIIHDVGFICGPARTWAYTDARAAAYTGGSVIMDGAKVNAAGGGTADPLNMTFFKGIMQFSQFDFHPNVRWALYTEDPVRYEPVPSFFDLGIWAEYDPMAARDYALAYSASLLAL